MEKKRTYRSISFVIGNVCLDMIVKYILSLQFLLLGELVGEEREKERGWQSLQYEQLQYLIDVLQGAESKKVKKYEPSLH